MTIQMAKVLACCACAMAFSFGTALHVHAFATPPSFTVVGDLPGGTYSTSAFAVSPNGEFVCGASSSSMGTQAFIWSSATGIVALDDLPNSPFYCAARGVTNDGVVVGYGNYASVTASEATRWINGVPQGLGQPKGMLRSFAYGASGNGEVILTEAVARDSVVRAYLWSEKDGYTPVVISQGNTHHSPAAISADGLTVVGECDSPQGVQAFIWNQTTGSELLGDLVGGSFVSYSTDVSADGSVVVGQGQQPGGTEATRWTRSTGMTGLGFLSPTPMRSSANAVNADGSIVVGVSQIIASLAFQWSRAFIWDQHHGMRNLTDVLAATGVQLPAGLTLSTANDISADGRTVIGIGFNTPLNRYEGFRVQLGAPGDANYDGTVNVADLLAVIAGWGPCASPTAHCAGDVAPAPLGDTVVDVADLLAVIAAWGS